MATYRSTVNARIVSTDAVDMSSVRNVLNTQYGWPKRHGYASHIVYNSGGRPIDSHSNRSCVTRHEKSLRFPQAFSFFAQMFTNFISSFNLMLQAEINC